MYRRWNLKAKVHDTTLRSGLRSTTLSLIVWFKTVHMFVNDHSFSFTSVYYTRYRPLQVKDEIHEACCLRFYKCLFRTGRMTNPIRCSTRHSTSCVLITRWRYKTQCGNRYLPNEFPKEMRRVSFWYSIYIRRIGWWIKLEVSKVGMRLIVSKTTSKVTPMNFRFISRNFTTNN